LIFGITTVRVKAIFLVPKTASPIGASQIRFICNIYEIGLLDATASQLKAAGFAAFGGDDVSITRGSAIFAR
jgi:hypothetical protein